MKVHALISTAILVMWSCAEGNFSGDTGDANKKSFGGSTSKCKPTKQKPCVESNGLSTSGPGSGPGSGPESGSGSTDDKKDLDTTDGGQALLNRSVSNFYFSGNGPGSCTYDTKCGLGAPACEAGSQDAGAGILGDCPTAGAKKGTCFGNRRICSAKGKLPGDRVAIDFHLFVNQGCPTGWDQAGPVPGQQHHVVGYSLDNGKSVGYYVFCRKTIPTGQLVSKFHNVVTDIRIAHAGERRPTAAPCLPGYAEAGVLTDCVNGPGVTPAGSPSCSGQIRVCKKFELFP